MTPVQLLLLLILSMPQMTALAEELGAIDGGAIVKEIAGTLEERQKYRINKRTLEAFSNTQSHDSSRSECPLSGKEIYSVVGNVFSRHGIVQEKMLSGNSVTIAVNIHCHTQSSLFTGFSININLARFNSPADVLYDGLLNSLGLEVNSLLTRTIQGGTEEGITFSIGADYSL